MCIFVEEGRRSLLPRPCIVVWQLMKRSLGCLCNHPNNSPARPPQLTPPNITNPTIESAPSSIVAASPIGLVFGCFSVFQDGTAVET